MSPVILVKANAFFYLSNTAYYIIKGIEGPPKLKICVDLSGEVQVFYYAPQHIVFNTRLQSPEINRDAICFIMVMLVLIILKGHIIIFKYAF